MDAFAYIIILCLFILDCALIHELIKARADISDLEYEVTEQKLEYRGSIKRIEGKISEKEFNTWIADSGKFVHTCETCNFRQWCDEKRECATQKGPETQYNAI